MATDQIEVRRRAQGMREHARETCVEAANQRQRTAAMATELDAQRRRVRVSFARLLRR